MTTFLLIQKIFSLFLVIGAGVLIVKCKVLDPDDSKVLSKISVYLIFPCVMINVFLVEYTKEIQDGIRLAFTAAILVHIGFLILSLILHRVFHMKPVETMSVVYPNAINLIMPIVMSVWGDEYLIYASAFGVVQQCMMWSHGRTIMSGKKGISFRELFLNIQMISILIGLVLLFTRIRPPQIVQSSLETVSDSLPFVSMLVIGMLVGTVSIREIFRYKRIWIVAALRLLVCPLLAMIVFRLLHLGSTVAEGSVILAICILSTASPSANMVVQMAQIFDQDARYASMINVITVLLCIVTMPVMLAVYLAF